MASIRLISDIQGNTKSVDLKSTKILTKKIYEQAIFDSILTQMSGERQGTHSTLSKGEVRGGGRKPYRQKHTGKARQGSTRNPQWVGGGVAFGPKPNRNYKTKVNAKVYKLAFRSAITLKFNSESLNLLADKLELKKPSSKTIKNLLNKVNLKDKKVLFVMNDEQDNFLLSCRNMVKVESKLWNQVSVKDLVNADMAIIQEDAFNKISEVFA